MLRYQPMALELKTSIKRILEQLSICLFTILNKHTRQGNKNIHLLCPSLYVVHNSFLQYYRRVINLLKLEV